MIAIILVPGFLYSYGFEYLQRTSNDIGNHSGLFISDSRFVVRCLSERGWPLFNAEVHDVMILYSVLLCFSETFSRQYHW